MKTMFKAMLVAMLVFTMVQPVVFAAEPTQEEVVASSPVKLIKAQLIDNHYYYTLSGQVEIINIAFKKQVAITWNGDAAGGLIEANYKMPLENGHELWTFKTNINKVNVGEKGLTFAIRFKTAGKTFWDNNNYADYTLDADMNNVVLGNRNVAVEASTFDWTENAVNGTVIVRNLGYPKTVKITYTTDRWITKKVAFAKFTETLGDANNSDNVERWTFKLPVDTNAKNVEYAVAYTVNKKTYWDNNNLINYIDHR